MSRLSVPVSERDHSEGPENAPVTLVEYGDFQCPSCGDAFVIVKRLQKHFGERLRFVFRSFPLPMHPYAEHASEAAEFGASQGKFWEMHDLLFRHQRDLEDRVLRRLASEAGLSPDDLTSALEAGTYEERVAEDVESGEDSGVHGTPTFFINGQQHRGSYDPDTLLKAIEAASSTSNKQT